MSSTDFRRFLEHCYDTTASLDAWVGGVASTLSPVIAPREGVLVMDGGPGQAPSVTAACGWAEGILPGLAGQHENAPRGLLARREHRHRWQAHAPAAARSVESERPRSRRSEQRALGQLACGATYKSIALELGVSVTTASDLVARGLRKLGFRSRAHFVSCMSRTE